MNNRDAARRKKLVERQKRQADFRERMAFPNFMFASNDGPREFVDLVKHAITEIDFRDRTQFTEWESLQYKRVRAGLPLLDFHSQLPSGKVIQRVDMSTHFILNLGEQIFKRIEPKELDDRFVSRPPVGLDTELGILASSGKSFNPAWMQPNATPLRLTRNPFR